MTVSIAFVDLAARHREAAHTIERRVLEVLRSGRWVGGPVVAEAEAVAARWLGSRGAVGVASGTDALALALQAVGVGPGDEVVVPALTFFATAGAALAIGAEVVVADVGPDGLLDPEAAGALVGPRTRAVVPVHLFGNRAVRPPGDLRVVDDAAQAIGTEPAPRVGVLAALSAYPTKTWGAAGDAGFVAGDDEDLLERVRRLGNHGAVEPGVHARLGGHTGRASRLDAVQAAVLLGHAEVLAERIERRRRLARRYDDGLPPGVRPLPRQAGSSVHQYCVLVRERDRVRQALEGRGIATAVYYPVPLQRQPALRACRAGPTPVADALCAEILALPIADCGEAEVERVLAALHEVTR